MANFVVFAFRLLKAALPVHATTPQTQMGGGSGGHKGAGTPNREPRARRLWRRSLRRPAAPAGWMEPPRMMPDARLMSTTNCRTAVGLGLCRADHGFSRSPWPPADREIKVAVPVDVEERRPNRGRCCRRRPRSRTCASRSKQARPRRDIEPTQ